MLYSIVLMLIILDEHKHDELSTHRYELTLSASKPNQVLSKEKFIYVDENIEGDDFSYSMQLSENF